MHHCVNVFISCAVFLSTAFFPLHYERLRINYATEKSNAWKRFVAAIFVHPLLYVHAEI